MFTSLPFQLQVALDRMIGGGQGDSSGDDGTSSDSSDEAGVPLAGDLGVLSKALQARIRVRNLTSLTHLCVQVIIENNERLAASKSQKFIFQEIGAKHCDILDLIMKELWPEFSRQPVLDFKVMLDIENKKQVSLEFLEMLLHKHTEAFNLQLLKNQKELEKMWLILQKKCPNLKRLVHEEADKKKPLPLHHLIHFKKLTTIDMISFTCNDSLMQKLAFTFPKLEKLVITFEKLSAEGTNHLFKLIHLEKLTYFYNITGFSKAKKEKFLSVFYRKCLENLPKLKKLEFMTIDEKDINKHLVDFVGRHKSDQLTLKLEELTLKTCLSIPPERLPMVKFVKMEGPITCSKALSKFSHLTKLEMSVVASKYVMPVLKLLGKQIKELEIMNQYLEDFDGLTSAEIAFDFYEIFHFCPNLETFALDGTHFCEDPSIPLTAANFKCLKSFNITMYDTRGYQMPLPVMEHVLRAEKLEALQLYWTRCFPSALFNVLEAENKNHLQQLKYLCLDRMWVKNYKGYISSLKKVIARAPRLTHLKIGCCEQGVVEFKTSGLKRLCGQIPGLTFQTDYDDGFF